MYGNTAEVAEMIAREIAALGIKRIIMHNASHSDMSCMITDAFRYSTLIVGSATYSMRLFPEVESFMNAMETREIKNKVFATFSNFTWRMKLPVSASLLVKQSAGASTPVEVKEFALQVAEAMKAMEEA